MKLKNKRIGIIARDQFGYLIDYYKYSNKLSTNNVVDFICWDQGFTKLNSRSTIVNYIDKKGNIIYRFYKFLKKSISLVIEKKCDIVIISYFPGCSIIPIFIRRRAKILLDIRTGSVDKRKYIRMIKNKIIVLESYFFNNVSIISNSLKTKLYSQKNKIIKIIPLGADGHFFNNKSKNEFNLIYIGTLYNRNIHQTVDGFNEFYKRNKNNVSMSYTIIGWGTEQEENKLKQLILNNNLSSIVKYIGRIPYDQLHFYFNDKNVGISYIPITDYYNFQPPTKTFEYLLSGLITIATATFENLQIINSSNGICIQDDPKSFSDGLEYIYKNIQNYNFEKIKKDAEIYEWDYVLDNNLIIVLNDLL